jgi:hypothetical protein
VLSETEWRALREAEPDAVGWMQERIRERLQSVGVPDVKASGTELPAAAGSAASWGDDEY